MLIPLARLVLKHSPNDILLQQGRRHQESTQLRRVVLIGQERTSEPPLCLFSPNYAIFVTPLKDATFVPSAPFDLRFPITKPQTSGHNGGFLATERVGDMFGVLSGPEGFEAFERSQQQPLKCIKDACLSGSVRPSEDHHRSI